MKICHVTSIHNTKDGRIYYAECRTLKDYGYEVHIIGRGDSFEIDGIQIHGYGDYPKTLKFRMTKLKGILLEKCKEVDADIYHLHDPELLQLVNPLVKMGKKVIFDSHEDYQKTIVAKEWIPKPLRGIVSFLYTRYEESVCRKLSGYIACYHWTKDRVEKWCPNISLVFNYPSKQLIDPKRTYNPQGYIAYAGGISAQWLHQNIINALEKCNGVRYRIAGVIDDPYGEGLKKLDGWKTVDFLGRVDHTKVYEEVYANAIAGMATLDYIPQCLGHKGNLSNTKLFEYMMYGLPVICTDFELWKKVIDEYQCGLCVDPHDTQAISNAINWLVSHPKEAEAMGQNGIRAVEEKYNWETTSQGLIDVYDRIFRGI